MAKLNGGVLRRLREQKCLSQEDLAHRAGVSTRTLQRAEAGECAKLDTIVFIAEVLEVSPNELIDDHLPDTTGDAPDSTENGTMAQPNPIPVVLRRMTDGKAVLDTISASEAMFRDVRGHTEEEDAELIGVLFDGLRNFLDVCSDMTFGDQLRYGTELSQQLKKLQQRGWWILAGKKRHSMSFGLSDLKAMPWTTCVLMASRADDSIIVHREDNDPVALVYLPTKFNLA